MSIEAGDIGQPTSKVMRLRYAGRCRDCSSGLEAGTSAAYDRVTRTVQCVACRDAGSAPEEQASAPVVPAGEPEPIAAGTAGASARREHERRAARREARIREAHPHLGGLILAVTDDPQSTTAWAQGARGEELLGTRLDGLVDRGVRALHDRRVPGTRANIDHIAVGPAGVHVIDAKRYAGKRPEKRVEGWLFGGRTEKLYVGGRDCTKLVEGVHKQVVVVRKVLEDEGMGQVPVRGVLCFVEAAWPLIGGDFVVDDIDVLWPKKLAGLLLPKTPAVVPDQVDEVRRRLAAALASA